MNRVATLIAVVVLALGVLYGLERAKSASLAREVKEAKDRATYAKVQYGYAIVALEQNSAALRRALASNRKLRGEKAAAEYAALLARDSLALLAYIEDTDRLRATCEAVEESCAVVRERADSVIARQDTVIQKQDRQITSERRKGWVQTGLALVFGYLIGR